MPGYVDPVLASASGVPIGDHGFFRERYASYACSLVGGSGTNRIAVVDCPSRARFMRFAVRCSMSGYGSDQGYFFTVQAYPVIYPTYQFLATICFWGSANHEHHFLIPVTDPLNPQVDVSFSQMGTGPWGFAGASCYLTGFYEGGGII